MWQRTLILIAVAVGSYLLGNLNIALLISKRLRRDIRTVGSGNPGTMNMVRNFGKKLGVLTLVLDAVKGAIPCILGWLLVDGIGFGTNYLNGAVLITQGRLGMHVSAISVIVGHIFPVFLKFKGGKGIASSIGICLVAQPLIALISIALGIGFIFLFHMGSIGSFIIIGFPLGFEGYAISSSAGVSGLSPDAITGLIIVFLLFALTVFAHRKNLVRLFRGSEAKTLKRERQKKLS